MARAHVLLVDTDAAERARVARCLRHAGLDVTEAAEHRSILSRMYDLHPDLVVLEALSVKAARQDLTNIRALSDIPVVILADRTIPSLREMAELKATGWLIRPVGERAILSEATRHLGRTGQQIGMLVIDWESRLLHRSGEVITLSGKEYELLRLLASHEGNVLSSERLARTLWASVDRRSRQDNLKHYIWRLRKKIETDPYHPRYLQTVRGVGYRFKLE